MQTTRNSQAARSTVRAARRHLRFLPIVLFLSLLSFLSIDPADHAGASQDGLSDDAGFEEAEDPALALGFADPVPNATKNFPTDHIFRLTHDVPLGNGRTLRVNETFTLASWQRHPRRALLFLNGPAFLGTNYSIPVPGYDGTVMAAERGFFAYTADYLGAGESYKPAHGVDAGFAENTDALRSALRYIRFLRRVPKIDLLGEGIGGAIATQLAADPSRVRSTVLNAMLYKTVPEGPTTSEDFLNFLLSAPDGYLPVPPELYLLFLTGAPSEVVDFMLSTQAGVYPIGPFLVPFEEPPYFDPGVARVPGLVIFGSEDFLATPNDPSDLVADYGTSGAELIVLEGAGHAPRIESPDAAAAFWDAVFHFLDP